MEATKLLHHVCIPACFTVTLTYSQTTLSIRGAEGLGTEKWPCRLVIPALAFSGLEFLSNLISVASGGFLQ